MKARTWAIVLLVVAAIGGGGYALWYFSKARWIKLVKQKYGANNPALRSPAFPWHDYTRQALMELYRTGTGLSANANTAIVT